MATRPTSLSRSPCTVLLLLLPSGEPQEYSQARPRRREFSRTPPGSSDGGWFLRVADRMGFEVPVAAVAPSEELRGGKSTSCFKVGSAAARGSRCVAVRASTVAWLGIAVAPLIFALPEEQQEEAGRTLSCYKAAV